MTNNTNTKPETVHVKTGPILSILGFQIVFYGVAAIILYGLVTLNWKWLLIICIVIILQLPIKQKNDKYINFVLDYLKPQEYFSVTRYYQEPIPDEQKTIFGVHPHSIFTYGILCNANNKNYPNQKLTHAIPLGSRFLLQLPIIGLHFKLWGIQSVDPKNLRRLMKKGASISLVPGGFEQATLTTPKQLRVFIKQRKGFIKYALKYGYTIRPVIITNQHKAMSTFDGLKKFRLLMNKIKLPGTVYWSKYGLFFPPGVHMHTLVGKGIKGDRIYESHEQPNKQQINKAHHEYIEQIKRLYEKHKQKNNNTQLVIY